MKIGIDGSRAFIKNRTGIEEYSFQMIKNLRDQLNDHQVILYIRKNHESVANELEWPSNWKIKVIKFPRFWTQIGLSLEMLFKSVDTLLIPAHTVPIIHPKKTIVVIHGLEYEFCPKAYSFWEKVYMSLSIKKSCKWASKIISVSENTKKDLMSLYNVPDKKIQVVYEGYEQNLKPQTLQKHLKMQDDQLLTINEKYLLFIGRIEQRKNIANIIKAFEILKEKYKIPYKLVLAGKSGFGYEDIQAQMTNLECQNDIVELGFVSDENKWELLKKAQVFIFPTFYEGFGIPILEAQSIGCPVVASNNSSIPEVALDSALLINPASPEDIAESINLIISNESIKNAIIEKGLENVKRFSWKKCSKEIADVILKEG